MINYLGSALLGCRSNKDHCNTSQPTTLAVPYLAAQASKLNIIFFTGFPRSSRYGICIRRNLHAQSLLRCLLQVSIHSVSDVSHFKQMLAFSVDISRFQRTLAFSVEWSFGDVAESVPIGRDSCRTGPRDYAWRSDSPSTLCWMEALDGGDARAHVDYRVGSCAHAGDLKSHDSR